MTFEELLLRAKAGENSAILLMLNKFKPMLIKAAILDGEYDEDLYQELCIVLLQCIEHFEVY